MTTAQFPEIEHWWGTFIETKKWARTGLTVEFCFVKRASVSILPREWGLVCRWAGWLVGWFVGEWLVACPDDEILIQLIFQGPPKSFASMASLIPVRIIVRILDSNCGTVGKPATNSCGIHKVGYQEVQSKEYSTADCGKLWKLSVSICCGDELNKPQHCLTQ
jgi:hypothetical protein